MSIRASKVAVMNAHAHPLLRELCDRCDEYALSQTFKPEHDALSRAGLAPGPASAGEFELALLSPSKNRLQTHAWMAEAMMMLGNGGRLIMACANRHGGKAYETALKDLAGNISSASKSKCRIFSACKSYDFNTGLATQWIERARTQRLAAHGLISQPGLFSWDRPDTGSQMLLRHLPATLSGAGMDLCCGYGLLSEHILRTSTCVEMLHLIEADRLALDCARRNTDQWKRRTQYHWLDATHEMLPQQLDWAVCNPPFHSGHDRNAGLGQSIVSRACKSLKRGCPLYLVANRKLPYEHVLTSHLGYHETLAEAGGFKVILGRR